MTPPPRILVVGVPRSATSWVGRVLGATRGATYLGEPDNHEHCPFALRAKRRLSRGFYPMLTPTDEAPDYERLWQTALAGPPASERGWWARARDRGASRLLSASSSDDVLRAFRGPGMPVRLRLADAVAVPERPDEVGGALVVKSVHAQLALEWIQARWPVEVVVVLRDPLAVVSSWQDLGWLDESAAHDALDELDAATSRLLAERYGVMPPGAEESRLARATWLIGILTSVLVEGLSRHAEWRRAEHETLCVDPHGGFRTLADGLGLQWSDDVDRLLEEMNRPGRAYETNRVAGDLQEVWRSRLDAGQIAEARSVLETFPALSRSAGEASA